MMYSSHDFLGVEYGQIISRSLIGSVSPQAVQPEPEISRLPAWKKCAAEQHAQHFQALLYNTQIILKGNKIV